MVQEKERMQRHQLCDIRHFTMKPIPTPWLTHLALFHFRSALARVRLCMPGPFNLPVFVLAHFMGAGGRCKALNLT